MDESAVGSCAACGAAIPDSYQCPRCGVGVVFCSNPTTACPGIYPETLAACPLCAAANLNQVAAATPATPSTRSDAKPVSLVALFLAREEPARAAPVPAAPPV